MIRYEDWSDRGLGDRTPVVMCTRWHRATSGTIIPVLRAHVIVRDQFGLDPLLLPWSTCAPIGVA